MFLFWVAKWKAKDSAPHDSKHSLTAVCSEVFQECNFNLLDLFQNMTLYDIK